LMGESWDECENPVCKTGLDIWSKSSISYSCFPLTLILSHQGRGKKKKNGTRRGWK